MAIVYILTNESMSDIIKIGITDNLSRRLRELDNTSTPLPFECFYAVEVDDARTIESLLHEAFDDKRIRQNREFFNCTPEQAKSALKIAEKLTENSTLLITGGGAYNLFLIEKIKQYSKANVVKASKELIEFKEALIFAFLGVLKMENIPNCLASVTGAKEDVVGGVLVE